MAAVGEGRGAVTILRGNLVGWGGGWVEFGYARVERSSGGGLKM